MITKKIAIALAGAYRDLEIAENLRREIEVHIGSIPNPTGSIWSDSMSAISACIATITVDLRNLNDIAMAESIAEGSDFIVLPGGTIFTKTTPAANESSMRAVSRGAPVSSPLSYQGTVGSWMLACFGKEISYNLMERNHRFLEEALELAQAGGCTLSEAHHLLYYVYSRPTGEVGQEVGGVMVTLSALCTARGLDMTVCGNAELARCWEKIDTIRKKHRQKPKFSPLPGAGG